MHLAGQLILELDLRVVVQEADKFKRSCATAHSLSDLVCSGKLVCFRDAYWYLRSRPLHDLLSEEDRTDVLGTPATVKNQDSSFLRGEASASIPRPYSSHSCGTNFAYSLGTAGTEKHGADHTV